MRLLSADQSRTLDRRTIDKLGLPGVTLMETAGRAVVREICARVGERGESRLVTVLCGAGNNGGDGFVIARELAWRGFRVYVYGVGDRDKLKGEALVHHGVLVASGVKPRWSAEAPKGGELKSLHRSLLRSVVVVDALLGIGATQALREPMSTWVKQLDGRHEGLVVGVDVPSGVHADTGASLGAVAQVDLVVTLAAAKPGLFLGEGAGAWKELVVADIGVPPKWIAQQRPILRALEDGDLSALVRPRDPESHKGTAGHLLVVAGSAGKSGAALLAARSGLRAGAGLVTLATAGEIRARIEGLVPDIMVQAVRGGAAEAQRVAKLLEGKAAAAVGPGLGTSAPDIDLVGRVCTACAGPVLLDADALTALAGRPELAANAKGRLVLTPHPGEMARLLGCEVAEVQADRLGAAQRAAERFDAVVVLKGARTLIVSPDGRWAVRSAPVPALAVAGSGDVLAGVIGALLAQGLAPFEASCAGVLAHNLAGAAVQAQRGARGTLASDVVDELPNVWPR